MINDIEGWLNERASRTALGRKSRQVVDQLISAPQFAAYASAAQVARRAGVDAATVVRTARSLDYEGWPGLRAELRSRFVSSLSAAQMLTVHEQDPGDPIIRAVSSDAEALNALVRQLDVGVCRAIATRITGARRTVLAGSGSFAAPLLQLAHVGSRLGVRIENLDHSGRTAVTALSGLAADDYFVVFNLWRQPSEILALTRFARENGVPVAVVTDLGDSPLARLADDLLTLPSEGTSHFPTLTPAMALVHALLAEMTLQAGPSGRAHIEANDAAFVRLEKLRRDG